MKAKNKMLAGILATALAVTTIIPSTVFATTDARDVDNSSETVVLADFDFDSMNSGNDGFDGGNAVAAISGSNVSLEEHEDGNAVYIGNGSYLNITAKDGSSLLTGWDCLTISFDLKPAVSRAWVYFAAPDTAAQVYAKEKYIGFLKNANANSFTIERYNNTNGRPGNNLSGSLTNGEWNHVEVEYTEDKTAVKINDVEVSSGSSDYLLSELLKDQSILQIGLANWGSGEDSVMSMDNLKITATLGDSVTVNETLSVMEGSTHTLTVNGISEYADAEVTYKSGDESVAAVSEDGSVTGISAGTADIITTVSYKGAVKELVTEVTVTPEGEIQPLVSLNFDDESYGQATPLKIGLSNYTGETVYEDGRSGKAIRLNGYGLRLNQTNVGESYTVSMWMKHDSILAENQHVLTLGHGNSSSENWLDVGGDRGSNQTYQIWTRNTTSSTAISGWNYLDESAPQIAGEWVMLTLTGDGTNFCAYINGQPITLSGGGKTDASLKNAANILNGNTQDIYIGTNNWDTAFSGLVDDVAVYDTDLSEEEIQALYEQQYTEYVAEHLTLGNGMAVSEDINLPFTDADGKVTITWKSSDETIIAADGTVNRPETDADAEVTLTGTFTYGSAAITKDYTVTVKKADVSGDLQEAAEALSLCTVTAENLNLPDTGKGNTSITWSSSDKNVMTDDGEIVARPEAGTGNAAITLTATIEKNGESITKDFEVEVLEKYYGYIYGYITGDNDRTGSLHLAYSTDGENYTALNSNTGIHFAEIPTSEGTKNLSTGLRFTGISLFRKADGTFGLAAPQGKDQKQVYLYDSEDLLTYSNERLLATNTNIGNVSDVTVKYDASIDGYYLYWTSGSQQYANVTSDLNTLGAAVEAEYAAAGVTAATLPEGAKNGSVIGVTKAEYETIINHFAGVSYTSTEQPEAVTVQNANEIKDALPDTVSLSYSDGSSSAMSVAWDIDSPDFSKAGTYTVTGTLSSYQNPLIEERADPQILYDEAEKCYYFTASYPAYGSVTAGYDRIILRKASTISGLSDDDTEITIWKAPSSGQMARHVWAPELHQINGKWYVFFAAGNSDNIWAIRPYVLVCQGDDPYDASNWVKADGTAEIHAATSEDSSCFDSMSLDMTYFTDEDADGITHHYVIWAELSPSSLYMQEIDPAQPWTGQGEVIMLTAPEYGWERDSELVNEGPAILKHDGKIFCTFSASGTGPEYCIGLLYADENSDLMDPDSWTKLSYPVLTSDDVPGEYGPGHNSFTVDADGNPVFVYHARTEECYLDQCNWASADPLYDPCRAARVKNVHWSADGLPILNTSAEDELPEAAKTVTIQVTVLNDSVILRDLDEAVISGAEDTVETGEQICPDITVKWGSAILTEGVDYTVSYGSNTEAGKGTVTITAVEGGRYTGTKTVTFNVLASVIADFNFDSETEGLKGGNAAASTGGGSVELTDRDEGKAAKFTASEQDWLDVKALDGSSLLTGYDEITISYDIMPGTSGTNWVFYAAPDSTLLSWGTNGNKERYLGVLVKNGVMEVERYNNTGTRPTNPTVALSGSSWQHVDIVLDENCTVVYLNGVRVSKVDSSYQLTDILGTDSIFQIGKANWSPGEYSTMQLDNFKIVAGTELYDADKLNQAVAEIEEKLGDITMVSEDLELLGESSDGLTIEWSTSDPDVVKADGTVTIPAEENAEAILTAVIKDGEEILGTKDYTVTVLAEGNMLDKIADELSLPYSTEAGKEVYGNITLPETVNGKASVTWTTDHPEIVDVAAHEVDDYDDMPAGVVTRPDKDTDVTMTAAIELNGQSVTRTFTFTVKAAPEEIKESDYTDYFFAYFAGEGYADGEQIYFASSEDGLNWDDLNNNNPVLTSTLGEQGVRDPFIIRSPEGDKFYLIATDLKIYGNGDWSAAQNSGSQSLMVWESTDLVNWSDQRMVEVSAEIEAGCTWAPEATYDPLTGEYVVYWASRTPNVDTKQRVYYAKTRDFYTFTEPQLYIDKDQSSIDSTMIEDNGTYYRYTKNEGDNTNELGAKTKTIFIEKSSSVLGAFTPIASDSLNANQWVEGPTIFKLNADDAKDDTWCLLVDEFGGRGYYPLLTTDLSNGVFTTPETGTYQMPSRARHGTPIRITSEEYAAIVAAYGAPEETEAVTCIGETPELPETVTYATGVAKNVTWELEGVSFNVNPYTYVTVTGTVENSTVKAAARVLVIPENVEYMIDCANTGSEVWSALSSQLLNSSAADQPKTSDNTWGYTSTVGATNKDGGDMVKYSASSTSNPYAGGWWAEDDKNITYQVTLPAGEHSVMLGYTGWWSTGRTMAVTVSAGDETLASLTASVTSNAAGYTQTDTFTLDEETVVTINVGKGNNNSILSWLSVCGIQAEDEIDYTELQSQIDAAKNLNADDYTTSSYAAVKSALEDAQALVDNAENQNAVDEAAQALADAIRGLVKAADFSELSEYYAANGEIEGGSYTEDSYEAYVEARNAAKAVLDNRDASQTEVDNALNALKEAVGALKEIEKVSRDALRELYDSVKDVERNNYTEDSYAAFTRALDKAKSVLNGEDVTQAEVDEAYDALQKAYGDLEESAPEVDRTSLENLYNLYKDTEQGDYTDDSYQAFRDALNAAKAVLDNEDVTQKDVDAALADLQEAYNALAEKQPDTPEADKTNLENLYNIYKDVEQGSYTEDSYQTFAKALESAKTVLDDPDADQAEVDEAYDALRLAYAGLETDSDDQTVRKDKLQELYDSVRELPQGSYTEDSYKLFQKALDEAEKVLADENAAQEDVNRAYSSLYDAFRGLSTKTDPEITDNGANTAPSKTDSTSATKATKTGDTAPVTTWALLVLAAALIAAFAFRRRQMSK